MERLYVAEQLTFGAIPENDQNLLVFRNWSKDHLTFDQLLSLTFSLLSFIKKESDYLRILPGAGAERGGSQIYKPNELEKNIVHARMVNTFQQPMEVEGEVHYERRTQYDM